MGGDYISYEINDGFDNDELLISVASVTMAENPVLTDAKTGSRIFKHVKSTEKSSSGSKSTNSTASTITTEAVEYIYEAVYRLTISGNFNDRDGDEEQSDDKGILVTMDFPVKVKRYDPWVRE